MHHSKKVRFRVLLSLVFTLIFSAILAAQTETGSPSKNSSANPVKQRLEQILVHFGQTPPTGVEAQPQPVPARLDPRSAEAHQSSPLQEVRLSGAPTAAERYVFGRMDLATGNYPNGVAAGAFQTGGPQSIAVANDYSETVSIYVANADGTFQPRVDYATGVETRGYRGRRLQWGPQPGLGGRELGERHRIGSLGQWRRHVSAPHRLFRRRRIRRRRHRRRLQPR